MHQSQANFRELFDLVHGEHPRPPYWSVIAPWIEAHPEEREWLRSFNARRGSPIPQADVEDRWRLYSLDRVNQALLLRFQLGSADGTDWRGPEICFDDYLRFSESFGMTVLEPAEFSPFYHEIVEVDQSSDDDEPISVLATFWPCLMLGDMLFSRAGAHVSGGRQFIRREVAESSTLYWAYRRKNRPHQDQSHGWGSNSQWRTCFRRDYQIGSELYYNVDGTEELNSLSCPFEDRLNLTRDERIELLTNRCFIRTTKPHDDLYPYDDRFRAFG